MRRASAAAVVLVAAVALVLAAGDGTRSPLAVDGLHVVLIKEATGAQTLVLQWADVHLCDVAPGCCRILDQHADLSHEEAWVREAVALPRTSVPWIVVATGRDGFAGPVPESVEALQELLRRYAP